MPQMSPINWIIITSFTLITLTLTYTMKWNNPTLLKKNNFMKTPNNKIWKW